MPSDDPVRSAHARVAALARSAREPSGAAMLTAANKTFRDSFLVGHACAVCKLIEVDQTLPLKERQRIADAAYRLHMSRLSLRASAARRRASKARAVADQAEAELAELAADGNAV
jgi:hypothetical protein